jgi:predicted DCC family thiol-disulfide oxidoreductase YuxK
MEASIKNQPELPQNIIFFDGVCNLCNGLVNFLWKIDSEHKLRYSSLQSEFAKNFLKEKDLEVHSLSTVYFYSNHNYYSKSRAIGNIFLFLKMPYWVLGKIILFVPTSIADAIYSFIGKHRYRLWGKSDSCRMPTSEEKEYFLENQL